MLDMAPSDLALKIIPAAIPKLTEDKSREGLEALAHSVGYGLQQMMLEYGHHVVAKYLYGGNVPLMSWHSIFESLCLDFEMMVSLTLLTMGCPTTYALQ